MFSTLVSKAESPQDEDCRGENVQAQNENREKRCRSDGTWDSGRFPRPAATPATKCPNGDEFSCLHRFYPSTEVMWLASQLQTFLVMSHIR
jgi:hypothetical protein